MLFLPRPTLWHLPFKLLRASRRISSLKPTMAPTTPLPFSSDFKNADEYIESLLEFSAASTIFQTLCGGVHILDFFTREPSLYHTVIPAEWRSWLMARDSMDLLDFLMRDDLEKGRDDDPPESLLKYIRDIRKHSLRRTVAAREDGETITKLPRHVAVGMIPKKVHEVSNFADYVVRVADSVSANTGKVITHYVDFGSGQNYLGRTLASPPYNKHIVAVESKELNITGAKSMDVLAGVAEREKVMRNKKVYRMKQDNLVPAEQLNGKALRRAAKSSKAGAMTVENEVDLRPSRDLATIYTPADGKGYIQYVEHVVQDGDLSDVVEQIEKMKIAAPAGKVQVVNGDSENPVLPEVLEEISKSKETRLMAISIHSCGNLSHHGIRSLLLNPSVHAIAIVGCCYNLMTERLGPPTYKLPLLRPNLRAINASGQESTVCDPHGFPMSEKVSTHNGDGVRLNITARMMAVQAPLNWTEKESDSFFTRHFYRALLQRVFLDFGVVKKLTPNQEPGEPSNNLESTEPVIIGSLRKGCYGSFKSYLRGALDKLANDPERSGKVGEQMKGITDEQIEEYSEKFGTLKKELSVTWSLMAFSAGVVESLIVTDRWLWLREQEGVGDAWVEAVFDYGLSPRNLVVVGIKE
ncbi:methyltransferase domain-containing protein [Rhexocercosporidium sp. MPI-PUGE-AT-0058]|nr:methyltransferase domain-containing protein [Rhexocercosporidium sp. MPI-PUGE-AT-0058]